MQLGSKPAVTQYICRITCVWYSMRNEICEFREPVEFDSMGCSILAESMGAGVTWPYDVHHACVMCLPTMCMHILRNIYSCAGCWAWQIENQGIVSQTVFCHCCWIPERWSAWTCNPAICKTSCWAWHVPVDAFQQMRQMSLLLILQVQARVFET